jgi:hypothetical protein
MIENCRELWDSNWMWFAYFLRFLNTSKISHHQITVRHQVVMENTAFREKSDLRYAPVYLAATQSWQKVIFFQLAGERGGGICTSGQQLLTVKQQYKNDGQGFGNCCAVVKAVMNICVLYHAEKLNGYAACLPHRDPAPWTWSSLDVRMSPGHQRTPKLCHDGNSPWILKCAFKFWRSSCSRSGRGQWRG